MENTADFDYKKSKLYTGTGDRGKTSLLGPEKTGKSSEMIRTLGDLDELNSVIGLVKAELKLIERNHDPKSDQSEHFLRNTPPTDIVHFLHKVQEELFTLGFELMVLHQKGEHSSRDAGNITEEMIKTLEKEIDLQDSLLPHLASFCIPGENRISALFHVARTVCRRAERQTVAALEASLPELPLPLVYLNRLSDLLFVLARKYERET